MFSAPKGRENLAQGLPQVRFHRLHELLNLLSDGPQIV
jgi:hypothetical protein